MSIATLKAGAGAAPIVFSQETFPTDGLMAVHDNPYLRVLVLDCGIRVALCSCELVNVPNDGVEMIKTLITEATQTKPENIWVHATHAISTPHAPYDPAMGGMPPPPDKADPNSAEKRKHFVAALEKAAKEAVAQAAQSMTDAVLSLGTGTSNVNINRDVETPFGWWLGHNPDGYSNKTATVLRVNSTEGALLGVMVFYGLKPCAIDNSEMKKGTRLVSSDVPGRAMVLLEQELGAPCLFFMTAAGDQVPREQAWYEGADDQGNVCVCDVGVEKGLEFVQRLGDELAADLKPIIAGAHEVPVSEIRRAGAQFQWPAKKRIKMQPRTSVSYEDDGEKTVDTDVITIGDIAFVAAKPEVNAITEKQLQEASPYGTTLMMSMVNGGMKYMPDAGAYDRITWESQSAMLQRGAAEAWVEKTVEALSGTKA